MRRIGIIFLVLFLIVGMSACSKNKKTGTAEGESTSGLSDEDLSVQNSQRWADKGSIPNAQEGGPFQDIHFDFDSSEVRKEYHEQVKKDAETLRSDPSLRVEVEGHCDKRGTTEYNMALGERRAKAVAKLLLSFGAHADQLSTVSYGAELPLEKGDSEAAYAKNRRVHLAAYSKNDAGSHQDGRSGSGARRY